MKEELRIRSVRESSGLILELPHCWDSEGQAWREERRRLQTDFMSEVGTFQQSPGHLTSWQQNINVLQEVGISGHFKMERDKGSRVRHGR